MAYLSALFMVLYSCILHVLHGITTLSYIYVIRVKQMVMKAM
jgi:hypothetical protein